MIRAGLLRERRLLLVLAICLTAVVTAAGAGAAVLRQGRHTVAAGPPSTTTGLISVRTGKPYTPATGAGRLTLLSFLTTQPDTASTPSRSEAVVLTSLAKQYGSRGLTVAVVAADPAPPAEDTLVNTSYDWALRSVVMLSDPGHRTARHYAVTSSPTTFLIDGTGTVLDRWDGFLLTAKAAAVITSRLNSRSQDLS